MLRLGRVQPWRLREGKSGIRGSSRPTSRCSGSWRPTATSGDDLTAARARSCSSTRHGCISISCRRRAAIMSDRMDTLIANIRDRCIHGSIIEAFEALAAEVDSVRVSSARKEAEAAQKEAEQAYVHLEAKVSGLEKARDEAERHESVAKHGRREAWHAASQLADGIRKALTYVTPGATDVAVRAALKEYETSGVQPKAVKAVRDIQEASAARGTDQITDAEIDAEIKAVRDARATT